MKVYHGTISSGAENIIKNGISLTKGKRKVDFGQGFYTTSSFKFAKSTAMNKAKKTNSYNQVYVDPYVITFEYDERKAEENCNILSFIKSDVKWAQFIINNRNGFEYMDSIGSHFHNINQNYDIVQGSVADNDIDNMVYNYITNQISFHTDNSLNIYG